MPDFSTWSVEKSVINYIGEDDEKIKAAEAAAAEYSEVAEWCNSTCDYTIVDSGDKYVVERLVYGENENA